jgi:hypothetical protein
MPNANISYSPPYGASQPGSADTYGAGGGGLLVGARSISDARRMMLGARAPQAQYPDGYLGTIVDRRQDRLMTSLQGRLTQRSYQRGVHKGEHIDLSDYFWTSQLNLESGLKAQAKGERWNPSCAPEPQLTRIAGSSNAADMWPVAGPQIPPSPGSGGVINPKRASQLGRLRPAWR